MEYIAQFLAEAVAAAAEPAPPEGGVWTESDHSRLIRLAATGTEAGQYSRDGVFSLRWRDGDAFRPVPGRKGAVPPGLKDAIRLFLRAPAGALAEAALRGRREGCVPAAPVLALVFLTFRDDALFRETFPRVVLDGADLRIYLDLARSVGALGRGAKAALREWLRGHATLREAQLHRAALADAIRLSHFRGEDPLFAWILAAYNGVKGVAPDKVAAAEAAYPALAARREFIRAVEAGRTPALRLLDTPGLEVDNLPVRGDLFTADGWRAFSRRLSPSRFLELLTMLRRQGALDADVVVQRAQAGDFRDVSPMLLYAAWRALWDAPKKWEDVSEAFDGESRMMRYAWKGSCPFCADPEGLRRAREALASAKKDCFRHLDWRAFGKFSWALGGCFVYCYDSPVPPVFHTPQEFGHLFAELFSAGLKRMQVPSKRIAGERNYFESLIPRNPAEAIEEAIRAGFDADCFLFFDFGCEGGCGRAADWLPAWKRYRRLHPKARAFLLDVPGLGPEPVATALAGLRLALAQPVVPDDGVSPIPAPDPDVPREEPWESSRRQHRLESRLDLCFVARKEGGHRRLPLYSADGERLEPAEWLKLFREQPGLEDQLKDSDGWKRGTCIRLATGELKSILRLRPRLAGIIRRELEEPTIFGAADTSFPDTPAGQRLDIAHLEAFLAEHPDLSIRASFCFVHPEEESLWRNRERYYGYDDCRRPSRRRRKRPAVTGPVAAENLPSPAPDTGAGWVDWLRAHPEDGAACEWGKLGAEDWIRLLSSNPEWAWRPEWRRLVPEGEWKAFLRERRRADAFRSSPRAVKPGRWIRHAESA